MMNFLDWLEDAALDVLGLDDPFLDYIRSTTSATTLWQHTGRSIVDIQQTWWVDGVVVTISLLFSRRTNALRLEPRKRGYLDRSPASKWKAKEGRQGEEG
jgi:hypothetical protein